jgi:tripartite ATP-independent transporter DctP family solute receptor
MTVRRFFVSSAIAIGILLSLGSLPSCATPIKVKIAHTGSEQTLMHRSLSIVAKEMEEKSNGTFSPTLYPNAQLGNESELLQAIQQGDIQMMATNNGYLVNFQPINAVFSVPFAFPDEATAYKVLDGPFGKKMLDAMESGCGLKGLAYYESVDFRQMTSNRGIHKADDLKGLKIRVMPNPIHIAIWESMGANPTAIPFGELYTALQQGTVDAQENPVELILQSKFSEVQKFMTLTNHIFSTGMAVASRFLQQFEPRTSKNFT